MRKLFWLVVSFVVFQSFYAQNLVPNSSFENIDTCPSGFSQLYNAFFWSSPVNNSADLYNTCSELVGVPANDNSYGYQYAN